MIPDVTRDLLAFLTSSPTPYHAVASAITRLEAAGFTRIDERDAWSEVKNRRAYLTHGDSALLAFVLPDTNEVPRGFRIVGAHTDSPNLRLKAKPSYVKEGYAQLGVEVYGGALLNSWLDRDLALAGRVLVRADKGDTSSDARSPLTAHLVQLDKFHIRVPQLAVHLDRDVNDKGLVLNRQEHLAPIVGLAGDRAPFDPTKLAAEALGIDPASIAATEWHLYDTLAPALGGVNEEFLFSGRLDNLAMSHAATTAIIAAASAAESSGIVPVAALFDHEEVGSDSAYGAASALLPRVLERITRRSAAASFESHAQALARSSCLSADMAHAVHPNYESRHEPRHKPQINGGPVLKRNAQQRYATSARTGALFTELCREIELPVQEYVNRTDLPCGSTIGPITSTLLGIPTADIGNAMLSMHSAREMAGSQDPERMVRALTAFFSTLREA